MRWSPWVVSTCVGGAAIGVLALAASAPVLQADVARDFLLARDCVELGRCHLRGATSAFLGITQGALWVNLIALVTLLGGGVATVQALVITLLGASVGALHHLAGRWLSPRAALPTAGIFLAMLLLLGDQSVLWNPSLSPALVVLASAALLQLARGAGPLTAASAGVLVGVGASLHVSVGLLMPPLVALLLLGARRPAWSLLAALASFALVFALSSLDAATINLEWLASSGTWRLTLGALAAVAGVALLARGAYQRRPRGHTAIAAAVTLATGALGAWASGATGLPGQPYYLFPAAPMAAGLLGALVAAVIGRLPHPAARAAILGVALAPIAPAALLAHDEPTVASPEWTATDVEAAARRLLPRYSLDELVAGLQGPRCWELTAAIGVYASGSEPRTDAPTAPLVLRISPDLRPPAGVDGEVIEAGGGLLYVRHIPSWLDRSRQRVCHDAGGPDSPCTGLTDPESAHGDGRDVGFEAMAYPVMHPASGLREYHARYEIAVVPRDGEERTLMVMGGAEGPCVWRIEEARGLDARGPLPSTVLTLGPGASGVLVVGRDFGPACRDTDRRVPPCFVEVRPDERGWLMPAVRAAE